MQLIYGTRNPSKLETMQNRLSGLGIDLIGLETVERNLEEPDEAGKSPSENAKIKALSYYHQLKRPVMSHDSGLYFEEVEENDQPGVFIKRIHGQDLEYSELVGYYSQLATKYGGRLTAHYKNAICLVLDENRVYTIDGKALESEAFYIVDTPHANYKDGFPLDSLSVEMTSNKYYYDCENMEEKYPHFGTAIKAFLEKHMG